jgi:hypothetical protein
MMVCYDADSESTKRRRRVMAKGKKRGKGLVSDRIKLTAEESLKRLQEFAQRKEHFIATIRKGKDRGISA